MRTRKSHSIFILLLTIVTLACGSCSSESDHTIVPETILSQERFTEVYTEAMIIEAAFKQKMYKTEDPQIWLAKQYNVLFANQNISSETYDESYTWYSTRPELLLEIYSEVIENLGKQEAKQNAETNP